MNETTAASTDSQSVSESAGRVWEQTKERAGDALQSGERYVREHPGASLGRIFTMGVFIGIIVGYALGREDDYHTRARKYARQWGSKFNFD